MHALAIFLSISATQLVNGFNVTLYTLPNRKGKSIELAADSCFHLPQWFLDSDDGLAGVWMKPTSVGTDCMVMHAYQNCQGYSLLLRPDNLMYHSNLSRIGFNKFAKSVGPCELIRVERAPPLLISTIYSLPFAICCAITATNASVVLSYLRTKRKDRKLQELLRCPLPPLPDGTLK